MALYFLFNLLLKVFNPHILVGNLSKNFVIFCFRYAGGIEGTHSLLAALSASTELHGPTPLSRWDPEYLYNPSGGVNRVSSRIGTFVHSIFAFDQDAFGLAPNESALMDPQQRVLLEETVHAFHCAGVPIWELRGSSAGVYVGCIWLEYDQMLATAGVPAGAFTVTG